jgi:2',3'-cyclic-nucleotide 2'-phosphodiesterase (5'-nucleotidase family)
MNENYRTLINKSRGPFSNRRSSLYIGPYTEEGAGMKHVSTPSLILLALIVFTFSSCESGGTTGPVTLSILHTNDMHAAYLPNEAFWVRAEEKPFIGGFRELAYVVDSVRRQPIHSLLLDAGDVMTGTPLSDREYRGAEGGLILEMMNMIGYDVWCPGNHDLTSHRRTCKLL